MTANTKKPHWSKNPIVWLIIFFPSVAVIAGMNLLYLAIESDDGLVDSDYYKQGLGVNKTISADLNAIQKNISGLISINSETGAIQARFSNEIKTTLKKSVNFKLVHRTIPGFDQKIILNQVDDTMLYTGKIKPLPQTGGRWRWEIKQDDWRVSKRFMTRNKEVIVHTFPNTNKE